MTLTTSAADQKLRETIAAQIEARKAEKRKGRQRLISSLRRRGFNVRIVDGGVRPSCDQCEVLCINGVACHETGCPNSRR